jgi:superfamily II DNA/RNA helicase
VQSVYGGAKSRPQLKQLADGVEVLVATPGRLLDFLKQKVLSLDRCRFSCAYIYKELHKS